MVERYVIGTYQDGGVIADDNGDYVEYEDYTTLETEHKSAMLTISAIMEMLGVNDAGSISGQVAALLAENAALKDDHLTTPALKRMGWPKTPATDSSIANIRAIEAKEISSRLEEKAEEFDKSAHESEGFQTDNRYRFAAAMFRGFAAQLRKESTR